MGGLGRPRGSPTADSPRRSRAPRVGGGIISGVRDGLQLPTLGARLVDGVLLLAVVSVGVLWVREAWSQDPSLVRVLAVVGVFVAILVTGRGRRRDPLAGVRRVAGRFAGPGSSQLSDNGRYVACLKVVRQVRNCTEEGDTCRYWAPYVSDRITNRVRRVATTSKGRSLPMPSPSGAGIDQLGFKLGGISGNGRYVVFTEAHDTKGVYVKDMKRGTLKGSKSRLRRIALDLGRREGRLLQHEPGMVAIRRMH